MQLVPREEREPTDPVTLVFSKLDTDVDGYLVLSDLASVEELHEELSLSFPFCEQFG